MLKGKRGKAKDSMYASYLFHQNQYHFNLDTRGHGLIFWVLRKSSSRWLHLPRVTTPSVAWHISGVQLNTADHLIENSESEVTASRQTYGLVSHQRKKSSHCIPLSNITPPLQYGRKHK